MQVWMCSVRKWAENKLYHSRNTDSTPISFLNDATSISLPLRSIPSWLLLPDSLLLLWQGRDFIEYRLVNVNLMSLWLLLLLLLLWVTLLSLVLSLLLFYPHSLLNGMILYRLFHLPVHHNLRSRFLDFLLDLLRDCFNLGIM